MLTSGRDLFVRRYDQAGSESWTRRTPNGGLIAADTSGFYVAGGVGTALPGQCYAGGIDVLVTRYDTKGNELWTREFGTAGYETPTKVAADGLGLDVVYNRSVPSRGLARLERASPPVTDSQPRILWECILNAASYLGGGVAPGEIVTIRGSAMGPSQLTRLEVTTDGRVATALAGARVLFDGVAAPLIYVSDQQSSAIVPYAVAGKTTVDVQVEYNGVRSSAVNVPVFESRFGVFTLDASGQGQAAVVNQDGSINSPSNPAARGSIVSFYATGTGLPEPRGADDQITGDGLSRFKSSISIELIIDVIAGIGSDVEVMYYGVAPRSVPGLVQINARLPPDVAGGSFYLVFGISESPAYLEQEVWIAIR